MLSTVRSVVSFYYFWIPVFGSINFYEFAASLNLIRGGAREEAAHVVWSECYPVEPKFTQCEINVKVEQYLLPISEVFLKL